MLFNKWTHCDVELPVIRSDGSQCWYKNGHFHREDGPAIIFADGTQFWYKGGKRHRDDGPAAIRPDGTQHWFKNGMWHRDDGPAVIYPNGTKQWWVNDNNISSAVVKWLAENDITYPFSQEQVIEFKLRFA